MVAVSTKNVQVDWSAVLRSFHDRTRDIPWLRPRILYLHIAGSHSYGTATSQSDYDLRGCALGRSEHYLGCMEGFEQVERRDAGLDAVVYEVRKFFRLLVQANPSCLESLWVEPHHHIYVDEDIFRPVLARRDVFMSKKIVYTFGGYAYSQMARMETHRRWLLHPMSRPTREAFDLPEQKPLPHDHLMAAEAAIAKQMDAWGFDWERCDDRAVRLDLQGRVAGLWAELSVTDEDRYAAAARELGLTRNLVTHLLQERRYRSAMQDFHNYERWKAQRNPERAALEAQCGYDAKHAGHVIRLYRMAIEALDTGRLQVNRVEDGAELQSIRRGEWSYERLMSEAAMLKGRLAAAAERSTLPRDPDRATAQALCVDVVQRGLGARVVC